MKSRADFVTNSSSSSYTVLRIKSKKLADFLKQFGGLEEKLSISKDEVSISFNDEDVSVGGWSLEDEIEYGERSEWGALYEGIVPSKKDGIMETLAYFISTFRVFQEKEEEYEGVDCALVSDSLLANEELLTDSIKECGASSDFAGYGGDDSYRYEHDAYPAEMEQYIYEEIVREKGYLNRDSVSEADWKEFLADKEYLSGVYYLFDKGKGIDESGSITTLEGLCSYSYDIEDNTIPKTKRTERGHRWEYYTNNRGKIIETVAQASDHSFKDIDNGLDIKLLTPFYSDLEKVESYLEAFLRKHAQAEAEAQKWKFDEKEKVFYKESKLRGPRLSEQEILSFCLNSKRISKDIGFSLSNEKREFTSLIGQMGIDYSGD